MKKLTENQLFYTDKNTTHSYLPLYEKLLNPIHATAKHILEIGIGDFNEKNGGSVMMWADFFETAQIRAVDVLPKKRIYDELFTNQQIHIYCESDAYDHEFIKKQFIDKNIKFDFVLDDGPHSLESMKSCIELYHNLLTSKGILIIEDVQSIDWFEELSNATPDHLKQYVKTYDLRENKGRRDDLVFTIDKLNS